MIGKYTKEYVIDAESQKKRLIYTGPRYRVTLPEPSFKRTKIVLAVTALVMAVLFVAMGLTGDNTTRRVYAGLPYAAMIVPVTYACVDAFRFLLRRTALERMHYEGSFMHMFGWAVATMILSAAACVGGIVYTVQVLEYSELPFILLAVLLCIVSFYFFRQLKNIKAHIVEIPAPKQEPV